MKTKLIIAVFAMLVLAGGGYYFFARTSKNPVQEVSYQEVTVRKGDIAVSFSTDAVVQAEIVSIASPVAEKVTQVGVSVGGAVKKGTFLFAVDSAKLQYQYNAAMATFSKAVYERNKIDRTTKPDDYSAAQQVVNNSWNQVQIAKLALDSAKVYSPIEGTVAEVNVRVGEVIGQSTGAVVKIIKKDSLYVSTSLDESEVGKITKETPVTVDLDAYGKKVTGKIVSIAPMPIKDSAGYSVYPISIRLDDKTLPIFVGFEGTVQFVTKTVNDVVQIPAAAVFLVDSKPYVLKKVGTGSEQVAVTTGFTDGKTVEISGGLAVDDIVLVRK